MNETIIKDFDLLLVFVNNTNCLLNNTTILLNNTTNLLNEILIMQSNMFLVLRLIAIFILIQVFLILYRRY